MAMKDGQIIIKDANITQSTLIKSWGKMKWSRADQVFHGPAEIELLNKLAGIVKLPGSIEKERRRLNEIAQAVDTERMNPDPKPLYNYPVKYPLFRHQTRACNMCLLAFQLIPPPGKGDGHENT